MNKKVENLEKELDKHEQYSRRNSVLVHGIVETDDKVTYDLVIEAISTKMNIEISPADLYRMHRIGKKMPGQNKPRPIIVKLSRYKVRKQVFNILNIIETMSNATKYNFISSNVKGIQVSKKALKLFEYVKQNINFNSFMLSQETHSSVNDEK